ncbi:hypothetical protein BC940DRAFT_306892 [Gongronella butleri]|nr:hypothetical protein BC940DRAFT_306892 [Gongronella butleri]
MTANICVDYLAHDWTSTDIIQANQEIKKQLHQIKSKQFHATSAKERSGLQIEHDRLIRFQNALWRQMARLCTSKLGRANPMVHPSSVNWQKESDITWLYGPFYTNKASQHHEHIMLPPTPPPEGIKPVLKRQPMPSLQQQRHLWSKASSQPGSRSNSCSSASSTSSAASTCSSVRFSPEIERVEYLPESPVHTTTRHHHLSQHLFHDDLWSDDDEDDEDDVLWSMVLHLGQFVSKTSTQWLWSMVVHQKKKKQQQEQQQASASHTPAAASSSKSSVDMAYLCFNMTKSLTSLMATWVLYQSLWPFSWLIAQIKKKSRHPTASASLS